MRPWIVVPGERDSGIRDPSRSCAAYRFLCETAPVNAQATTLTGLSRQYIKLCDVADFDDPEILAMLREIEPGRPAEQERHRKLWEYALLGLYLAEVGAITPEATALSVAAGHEAPLYWLANQIERVVATDIYGEGAFSGREADGSMLTNPAAFAPYPYREDHLEVRDMNALELDFPDESFDIVFSLSSIEHFGIPQGTQRAAREMSRVLRPGGHLVITTECLVGNNPLDWPAVQVAMRVATRGRRCPTSTLRRRVTDVFTPKEIERYVVKATGLSLVQPLDLTISPATHESVLHWVEDGSELRAADGSQFPHILLQGHGAPWTSAFLAFRKS
jgi:SAM-dependent methyltransferase